VIRTPQIDGTAQDSAHRNDAAAAGLVQRRAGFGRKRGGKDERISLLLRHRMHSFAFATRSLYQTKNGRVGVLCLQNFKAKPATEIDPVTYREIMQDVDQWAHVFYWVTKDQPRTAVTPGFVIGWLREKYGPQAAAIAAAHPLMRLH